MYPFIHIGPLSLSTYGLAIFVGLLAAAFMLTKFPAKTPAAIRGEIKENDTLYAGFAGLAGVYVGAKLLYLLTILPELSHIAERNAFTFSYIKSILTGGFVFYGGFIGGILGVLIFARVRRANPLALLDAMAFAIPLAHGFGRIGCFLAGCCYGMPSEYGLYFRASDFAPHDEKLLPIQLIESGFNFALFGVLFFLSRRQDFLARRPCGFIFFLYITAYALFRFCAEFFRYDSYRGIYFGLSTSQWISLALILCAIIFFSLKFRKGKNHAAKRKEQKEQGKEKEEV
jgi:phosphatidylglycerol:prolipoprotein diacylglycerol transferase